ncbi:uncharacterized protein M421DRAFT_63723 [Didymella exigua CBS 183.55]|uniref:BTB domain-containing protein n=1 Tax=Didymella exigua CBS 183.55 TaxID=1150837 RepID=A0A6A5RLE0_9PLEO|nr:uncharacterized protein M421DRAFT_63723 [Didymella exigua CBS 183.55]KAF1928070.1 hypothetical protein M421DRAFT_63723 [Didymella exigua CBS 183.55]
MIELEKGFSRLSPADTEQLPTSEEADRPEPTTFPKILTLDVGGRKFRASADILIAESGLFRLQLSDRFTWIPESNGSYFLDANPTLFAHLLDFMRRPNIFPLFWNKADGFDYNLYQRLQVEAEYFQMDVLHGWIKEKNYLRAINIHVSAPKILEAEDLVKYVVRKDVDEESHVVPRIRQTYVCPRGLDKHRGDPGACGYKCRQVQGTDEPEYVAETYIELVTIRKEVMLDDSVCRA